MTMGISHIRVHTPTPAQTSEYCITPSEQLNGETFIHFHFFLPLSISSECVCVRVEFIAVIFVCLHEYINGLLCVILHGIAFGPMLFSVVYFFTSLSLALFHLRAIVGTALSGPLCNSANKTYILQQTVLIA